MAISNRIFNGKLNLDTNVYRLPEGDFAQALNITRDAIEEVQDVVVTNVIGNEKVDYTLPAGTNKVIGKFPDKIRNRIYYFIWNSNDNDLIVYYDRENDVIVTLLSNLSDTDGDILDFNPSKRILHVDIIYNDTDGDLIFWTDGNTTPKKLNVKHIEDGDYTTVKRVFIEVAKAPFLDPPTCQYGSDSTRNSNSLRRTLFQFCVRPVYDDFEKGVLFSFSKIPLPIGFYGSDNDIDNTKNNFITVTIPTGDENVTILEVGMRQSRGDAWSDVVIIASLNKVELNIPNNQYHQFLFYNDTIYPAISDGVQYVNSVQVIPLFFWVPQKAYCQALANGNVPVYGAITEGYNKFPINELSITITAENQTNVPPDTDPPSITYSNFSGPDYLGYQFTVLGNVVDGAVYSITFLVTDDGPTIGYTATYTATSGDTVDDVALGLYNSAISTFSTDYFIEIPPGSGFPPTGSDQFDIGVLFGDFSVSSPLISVSSAGSTPTGTVATEKTWMQDCPYAFGIVYADEQGRDMPGVITFSNPVDSDNDFLITTPSFETDSGDRKTPVITAEINHLPPDGSKRIMWVRRRLQYDNWVEYETCDFQDPSDGFYYLCLANIETYKEQNSNFIYSTVPIEEGGNQRLKVLDGITTDQYDGNTWGQDFQILGTVTRTLTGGSSPADDRLFIKIKAPASPPSPVYQANMLVMVYTPSVNPTTDSASTYYEWGETYTIYAACEIGYNTLVGTFDDFEVITGGTSSATARISEDGTGTMTVQILTGNFQVGETITGGTSGATANITSVTNTENKYHSGNTQNQTANQPAIYKWIEGDVYYHVRSMYNDISGSSPFPDDVVSIMDENFSDFFLSSVNDNGREQVIEVNAKQVYNPVLYRFGGAYQNGTTINNNPDFYFENFDEADRSWGDIRKMYIRNRYLYVLQRFKIGIVPVLLQIIRDTEGNPLEANSDQLLNKINYPYSHDVGIGDLPASFASDKDAMYGCDNTKGVVWRLSGNGMTILSVLYECNSFFVSRLKYYGKNLGLISTGDPTVLGVFDASTNKYIIAMEKVLLPNIMLANGAKENETVNPRYVVAFSKSPTVGDTVLVTLTTAGGTERNYSYTAVVGDTITTIANSLRSLINADTYFVSTVFSLGGSVLLISTQVNPIGRTLFTGSVEIAYGEGSFVSARTISFNEDRGPMEGFESEYSYLPEEMVCLDTLLVAFKDGGFWKFTIDAPRCNFFGVQYDASITLVFNDSPLEKKTWQAITQLANDVWECPEITTNVPSYGDTLQTTNLVEGNFRKLEGDFHASIKRDTNSRGGKANGDFMKGNYCVVKLLKQNASDLIYLNGVSVKFVDSPITVK